MESLLTLLAETPKSEGSRFTARFCGIQDYAIGDDLFDRRVELGVPALHEKAPPPDGREIAGLEAPRVESLESLGAIQLEEVAATNDVDELHGCVAGGQYRGGPGSPGSRKTPICWGLAAEY